MEKKRYSFEFRFEKAMQSLIATYLGGRMRGLSRLVETCLAHAMHLHEEGRLLFSRRSGFLVRENPDDRTVVMLSLRKEFREYARVLGFVYDLSMAEVIRIALEEILGRSWEEKKEQKNYYSVSQFRVQQVHISLRWPYPHIRLHINPAFPPGGF